MDVDNIKVELEKVKQELALATSGEQEDGEQHYKDIQDIWVRWDNIETFRNFTFFSVFIEGSRSW